MPALDEGRGREINLYIDGIKKASIGCVATGAKGHRTAYGVRYPLQPRNSLLGFQARDMCLYKIS